jgi:hypothetical protein
LVWFALGDDRPLTAFAGIWTEFKGDRGPKSKPVPGPHLVYGFLTTAPNAVVAPIHPKAMPAILTRTRSAMSGCARRTDRCDLRDVGEIGIEGDRMTIIDRLHRIEARGRDAQPYFAVRERSQPDATVFHEGSERSISS